MIVTVDEKRLSELKENILKFVDDPTYEKEVLEVMEAREKLEKVFKDVQEAIKQKLTTEGITSVEGELARVSLTYAGSKYKIVDQEKVSPEFFKIELNSKAVDDFVSDHSSLPEGVEENKVRNQYVRMVIKKGTNG